MSERLYFLKDLLIDAEEQKDNPLPIIHNDDYVVLQYCGWSLNLYEDGTWIIDFTEGG